MSQDSDDPPASPTELPMMRVSHTEYVQLAQALGTPPEAKYLVMTNGVRVGWQSNRFFYVAPAAFKVATGQFPKGYRP